MLLLIVSDHELLLHLFENAWIVISVHLLSLFADLFISVLLQHLNCIEASLLIEHKADTLLSAEFVSELLVEL